jgi:hypothetical protein
VWLTPNSFYMIMKGADRLTGSAFLFPGIHLPFFYQRLTTQKRKLLFLEYLSDTSLLMTLRLISTLFTGMLPIAVFGQLTPADSIARAGAIQSALVIYHQTLRGNAAVYNGIEYIDPFAKKRLNGHPYYLSDDWLDGSITYDGRHYESVSLKFNICSNKVLIEHEQTHAVIELIAEKINSFNLGGARFVRLPATGVIREGFYQLLYEGKSRVLVRRFKTIKETVDQKVMITEFSERARRYFVVNGQTFAISNRKSALNLFGELKVEIRRYLSDNHIHFRSAPEKALVAMAMYYDSLNP